MFFPAYPRADSGSVPDSDSTFQSALYLFREQDARLVVDPSSGAGRSESEEYQTKKTEQDWEREVRPMHTNLESFEVIIMTGFPLGPIQRQSLTQRRWRTHENTNAAPRVRRTDFLKTYIAQDQV